jgi:hypothetical protein
MQLTLHGRGRVAAAGILGSEDAGIGKARIAESDGGADAVGMTPAPASSEPHIMRATTVVGAGQEALERVARSLRAARARTGLSEEHVVALLTRRDVVINLALLRRAERTGMVDLALAASLADA